MLSLVVRRLLAEETEKYESLPQHSRGSNTLIIVWMWSLWSLFILCACCINWKAKPAQCFQNWGSSYQSQKADNFDENLLQHFGKDPSSDTGVHEILHQQWQNPHLHYGWGFTLLPEKISEVLVTRGLRGKALLLLRDSLCLPAQEVHVNIWYACAFLRSHK